MSWYETDTQYRPVYKFGYRNLYCEGKNGTGTSLACSVNTVYDEKKAWSAFAQQEAELITIFMSRLLLFTQKCFTTTEKL